MSKSFIEKNSPGPGMLDARYTFQSTSDFAIAFDIIPPLSTGSFTEYCPGPGEKN